MQMLIYRKCSVWLSTIGCSSLKYVEGLPSLPRSVRSCGYASIRANGGGFRNFSKGPNAPEGSFALLPGRGFGGMQSRRSWSKMLNYCMNFSINAGVSDSFMA